MIKVNKNIGDMVPLNSRKYLTAPSANLLAETKYI